MTVLHRSFFTGTNGVGAETLTPDVGSAVLVPAGAFTVQDNRIYGSTADNFLTTDQTLPADGSVSVVVRRLTTGGTTLWDLAARLNVFDSYFVRWTSGQLTLRKYIDPGPSVTLDTYSWTPSLNTDYTIELRCVGTSLEVYLDTVLVMSATDGDLTAAGDCALASETASTSTTGWHFDTLVLDDLVSEVPTGTAGGLVIGSATAFVGQSFVGSIETAGPTGYTLAADVGMFALAGIATGVRAARRLTADPRAYTLAGSDTALRRGFRIVANVAAFTLAGTATGLRAGRRIVAAVGAFVVAGPAAGVRAGRRILADVGAYTVSGTATALRRGYRVVANVGAFALGGSATGLRASRRIVAAAAVFTLTGTATGVRAGRRLVAGVGSYILTGQPVTLGAAALKGLVTAVLTLRSAVAAALTQRAAVDADLTARAPAADLTARAAVAADLTQRPGDATLTQRPAANADLTARPLTDGVLRFETDDPV